MPAKHTSLQNASSETVDKLEEIVDNCVYSV